MVYVYRKGVRRLSVGQHYLYCFQTLERGRMLKRGWPRERWSEVWRLSSGSHHFDTHSATLSGDRGTDLKSKLLAWADTPEEVDRSEEAQTEEKRWFFSCSALLLFSPVVSLILWPQCQAEKLKTDLLLLLSLLLFNTFFGCVCSYNKHANNKLNILK